VWDIHLSTHLSSWNHTASETSDTSSRPRRTWYAPCATLTLFPGLAPGDFDLFPTVKQKLEIIQVVEDHWISGKNPRKYLRNWRRRKWPPLRTEEGISSNLREECVFLCGSEERVWTIIMSIAQFERERPNPRGSKCHILHEDQENCALHYWAKANEWNKAYGTEASACTIVHVSEDFNMLRPPVTSREYNMASDEWIEKCPFIFEGKSQDSLTRFGEFENGTASGLSPKWIPCLQIKEHIRTEAWKSGSIGTRCPIPTHSHVPFSQ
jgi:RimJ/RimL family protein N-acetyltransferase